LREQAGEVRVEHFVSAMLRAGGDTGALAALRHSGDRPRLISYAGNPGSFVMYPYARVLNGSVPPAVFEGKYVLVGAWAAALGDILSVPLSRAGEPMAGVEILAHGLQNAVVGHWLLRPDRLLSALHRPVAVLP